MNQPQLDQLIELARRRVLTGEELARLNALLEANPAAWPDRNAELALTRLLTRLPDAPLASNLSSRVMREIEIVEAATGRASPFPAWLTLRGWVGRLAGATAVIGLSVAGWMQYQSWQRAEFARGIATISEVAAVPSVEVLRDFEAIHTFVRVPSAIEVEADTSLLAALQ